MVGQVGPLSKSRKSTMKALRSRNCSMLMDASYPSSNGGRILILLESTVMIAPEPKTSP